MQQTKNCSRCDKEYSRHKKYSDKQWMKSEFCCRRCAALKRDTTKDHKILSLYMDGLSSSQVGEILGITSKVVLDVLKENNLDSRLNSENKYLRLWKGGLSINEYGYFRFHNTPANGLNAGRRLHCVVAESIIGRPLESTEVVHHKDGNKLNNHPDNLEVMTRGEHTKLHNMERKYAKS